MCYIITMVNTITISPVMPSATPSEAEIAAWQALPRDEQMRRMQAFFADPDCSRVSPNRMDDILKRARAAAGLSDG
jgi:hypothetical protein